MAALDPADRPIAEKLRDLMAAKADRIFAAKKERAAVDAFYQGRNFAPLWLDKGMQNARAKREPLAVTEAIGKVCFKFDSRQLADQRIERQ